MHGYVSSVSLVVPSERAHCVYGNHILAVSHRFLAVYSIKVINGTFTLYDINTAPIDDYIVNGYLIT